MPWKRFHAPAVFLSSLFVYLSTMPRTVALEDDGEFILASFFNGVAHSPGYPVHTLLGHLFTFIPLGAMATRVHALSAVLGALTCAVLFGLVHRLTRCPASAHAASLSYAFSTVFWSQAIIAEVYTLNTLFFFSLLAMALHLRSGEFPSDPSAPRKSASAGFLFGFAFLYGLSLANHWPLIVLSTPGLAVILWPRVSAILRALPVEIPALLLGLTPYLWMYLHSQSEPPISFYGALESWSDLFHHISRAGYQDAALTADWGDKLDFLEFALLENLRQFSWIATGLAAMGVLLQRRFLDLPSSVALLLVFVATGVGLALAIRSDYDAFHEAAFRVFPLISYGILSVWIGFGFHQLLAWLRGRTLLPAVATWPGYALAFVLVATTLFVNLEQNDRRDDRWADRFARLVLESLPPGAILFVAPDPDIFPIGYVHYVEGVRPDVTVMNPFGVVFGNRLFSQLRAGPRERRARNTEFVEGSKGEVFLIPPLPADIRSQPLCLYRRVLRDSGVANLQPDPCAGFLRHLDWLIDEEAPDAWTHLHQEDILGRAVPWLVATMMGSEDPAERVVYRSYVDRIAHTVKTKAILVHELGRHPETFSIERRLGILAEAKALVTERTRKSRHAQIYLEEGSIHQEQREVAEAQRAFERAIEIWPHSSNGAARQLFKLYRAKGNRVAYDALRARLYPGD